MGTAYALIWSCIPWAAFNGRYVPVSGVAYGTDHTTWEYTMLGCQLQSSRIDDPYISSCRSQCRLSLDTKNGFMFLIYIQRLSPASGRIPFLSLYQPVQHFMQLRRGVSILPSKEISSRGQRRRWRTITIFWQSFRLEQLVTLAGS